MKITRVTPYVVKIRNNARGGVFWFFVKVETDEDVTGWGEIYWNAFDPAIYKAKVEAIANQFLVGNSPFNIEQFFIKVFTKHTHWHADLATTGIVSGLEMACWDIIGKSLNRPVYDLLGGMVNERIRTYSYLTEKNDSIWCEDYWQMEEACLERAQELIDMGFDAIKLDPFSPYIDNIAPSQPPIKMLNKATNLIRRLREEVCGDACDIIVGTHGQFTAAGAIRVSQMLEQYDPLWFEEPTPPENFQAMAKVARNSKIPIAAGERLATKWEYMPLIQNQCVDIVQLDIAGMGGILEAKKIAAIADAAHLQITPHFWGGPINFAAQIQLDVCSTNFLIQESIEKMDTHGLDILLNTPFVWEDGYIIPSNLPGLGIDLNESAIESYSVDTFEEQNVLL